VAWGGIVVRYGIKSVSELESIYDGYISANIPIDTFW
jgi:hypothetical protein